MIQPYSAKRKKKKWRKYDLTRTIRSDQIRPAFRRRGTKQKWRPKKPFGGGHG